MPHTTHERTDELHAVGLKVTTPRLQVLALFQDHGQQHLVAEDVYRMLQADGHDIGLATVYRVLTQFVSAGVLRRSQIEEGRAVFELERGEHHDHIICVRCGRIAEFVDADIERRQREIAQERGFELVEHTLAMYGVCLDPACSSARPAGQGPCE
jgi:Fur family ferric uptake transcriptional regulator